jgi:hypothetical protein
MYKKVTIIERIVKKYDQTGLLTVMMAFFTERNLQKKA